ncbi:MAG: Rab family GTPase [Acidobacteriota bacterium]
MIQKRISMLGAFAVGKTSLVARFVKGNFSAKYQTTVGVKLDWKIVKAGEQEIKLIIWDLAGEDEFQKVKVSNLQGSHGYLLVADGTRSSTVETARLLQQRTEEALGPVPFVLILNKADLTGEWEVDDGAVNALMSEGWEVIRSSALTGSGVEEAFASIARRIQNNSPTIAQP